MCRYNDTRMSVHHVLFVLSPFSIKSNFSMYIVSRILTASLLPYNFSTAIILKSRAKLCGVSLKCFITFLVFSCPLFALSISERHLLALSFRLPVVFPRYCTLHFKQSMTYRTFVESQLSFWVIINSSFVAYIFIELILPFEGMHVKQILSQGLHPFWRCTSSSR